MKKIIILVVFIGTIIVIIALSWIFSSKKSQNQTTPIETIVTPPISSEPFVIAPTVEVSQIDSRSDAPAVEWQQALDQYKGSESDFYLMNYATYTAPTFAINYRFKKTPIEHYAFAVNLTGADKNRAKQDAISWIKSKGLTDQQISTLDIEYIQQ